ncbi:MAG: hypothetical protein HQL37_11125 [Alphaproteobacteria bacterium]|nr:hypothetical protein [Desulfovibrionaceae bacterium]MBF0562550.1 hypothetical protein [Alphaproteobacteria bacterium]
MTNRRILRTFALMIAFVAVMFSATVTPVLAQGHGWGRGHGNGHAYGRGYRSGWRGGYYPGYQGYYGYPGYYPPAPPVVLMPPPMYPGFNIVIPLGRR